MFSPINNSFVFTKTNYAHYLSGSLASVSFTISHFMQKRKFSGRSIYHMHGVISENNNIWQSVNVQLYMVHVGWRLHNRICISVRLGSSLVKHFNLTLEKRKCNVCLTRVYIITLTLSIRNIRIYTNFDFSTWFLGNWGILFGDFFVSFSHSADGWVLFSDENGMEDNSFHLHLMYGTVPNYYYYRNEY